MPAGASSLCTSTVSEPDLSLRKGRGLLWEESADIKRIVSIFVAFCCACANGYDGSLMTGIIAMPYFEKVYDIDAYPVKTSLIMSLYTVYGLRPPFRAGTIS